MGLHHFRSMWEQSSARWMEAVGRCAALPEFLTRGQPVFEQVGLATALVEAEQQFFAELDELIAQHDWVHDRGRCQCLTCQSMGDFQAAVYCREVLVSPLWWTWDLPAVETPQLETPIKP